tara:strand:- start:123 stop:1610 length:1488 start_codon:yes stop_codon:yes gene_type:complete
MFQELWKNKSKIGYHYYQILLENKRVIISVIVLCVVLVLYILFQYNSYLDRQKEKEVVTEIKEEFQNYQTGLSNKLKRINTNKNNTPKEGFTNDNNILKKSQFLNCGSDEVNGENYTLTGLITYIKDNYLSKMNAVNMIARGFETKIEAISKYEKLCQNITEQEITTVNTEIRNYLTREEKRLQETYLDGYFKYWLSKIVLAKGQDWLESGMPHTHQNVIIMDPSWFSTVRIGTLIHEIGHVHQRLEPMEWEELITEWGFTKCQSANNKIVGLDSLLVRNRLNPDGMDCYWRWKDDITGQSYWIGAIFNSDEPESLRDVEYVGVELEWNAENGLWYLTDRKTSLNKLPSFVAYFGLDHDHYHPHEIGSHYLEKLLEETTLGKTNVSKTRGYQKFRKWFEKTYGSRLDTNVSFKKRKSIREAEAKERGAVKHIVNGKKIYEWNVLQNYPWIKIDEDSGSNYPLKSMKKMNENGSDFQVRKRDYYDFGDITYIGNPL